MGYDYDIVYKKGSENSAADALFRVSEVEVFNITASSLQPLWLDHILSSYSTDAVVHHLLSQLQQGCILTKHFVFDRRLVRGRESWWLVMTTICENKVLSISHDSLCGSHFDFRVTY